MSVRVVWNGAVLNAAVSQAKVQGMRRAAEHVLGKAREVVPVEETILSNSGGTDVAPDGSEAHVYFDTKYAVPQHERLDYRHAPGRTAKYLETPMRTENDAALAVLRDAIGRAL